MYNPLYEPTRKLDLITDGGSGIGRVFAQEMATLHHIVIVGGVNADSARQVCEEKKTRWHLSAIIATARTGEDRMLPKARRRTLLGYLSQVGSATIAELSKRFHVSGMTIRRDLKVLQQDGFVTLTHGGVIFDDDPFHHHETHRLQRETIRAAEKLAIGRYIAAHFVADDEVLLLDSGTTVRAIVPFLKNKRNLTVASNSLRTIDALHRHLPDCSIIGTGGMLRSDTLTFVGPVSERFFDDFFAHKAIISGVSLTVQAGLADSQILDTAVKKAMIRSAEASIVVIDSSKIGTMAMAQVLATNDISTLVTDAGIDNGVRQELVDAGIDLHVVPVPANT